MTPELLKAAEAELLARERAEVAQLKEKLTRWDIDYDRVIDIVMSKPKRKRKPASRALVVFDEFVPAKETP